jgi:hypothetical protein
VWCVSVVTCCKRFRSHDEVVVRCSWKDWDRCLARCVRWDWVDLLYCAVRGVLDGAGNSNRPRLGLWSPCGWFACYKLLFCAHVQKLSVIQWYTGCSGVKMSWYVCQCGQKCVALPVVLPNVVSPFLSLTIHKSQNGFQTFRIWYGLGFCWIGMYCR